MWLEIRIPKEPTKTRVHGVLKRARDGDAVADARIFFECFDPGPSGDLFVGSGSLTTDAHGGFELLLPRTTKRTYRIFGQERGDSPQLMETRDVPAGDQEPAIELVLP